MINKTSYFLKMSFIVFRSLIAIQVNLQNYFPTIGELFFFYLPSLEIKSKRAEALNKTHQLRLKKPIAANCLCTICFFHFQPSNIKSMLPAASNLHRLSFFVPLCKNGYWATSTVDINLTTISIFNCKGLQFYSCTAGIEKLLCACSFVFVCTIVSVIECVMVLHVNECLVIVLCVPAQGLQMEWANITYKICTHFEINAFSAWSL